MNVDEYLQNIPLKYSLGKSKGFDHRQIRMDVIRIYVSKRYIYLTLT